MKYILILLAVVAVSFFAFKSKIKNAITKSVQKRQKEKAEKTDIDFVYCPVGVVRNFSVDFSIEEMGNGEVKITIGKKVAKDV